MIVIANRRSWCALLLAVAALAVACVLVAVPLRAQGGGGYFIPGDPKAGMHSFFDKGCARCHSALGEGGHSAPDLARAPAGHLGSAELLAAMWNHAPQMHSTMAERSTFWPKFEPGEMRHLAAYLRTLPGTAAPKGR